MNSTPKEQFSAGQMLILALAQEVKLLREKLETLDRSGDDRTND